MVACSNAECLTEWFHYECVGLTQETVPEGDWYCLDCKKEEDMIDAMTSLGEVKDAQEKLQVEMEKIKLRQMRSSILREKKEILKEGARPKTIAQKPVWDSRHQPLAADTTSSSKQKMSLHRLLHEVGDAEFEEDGFLSGMPEFGGKKLKSGYYAKASTDILYPQKWPQTGLRMEYARLDLSFSQLTCNTMVAGEIETIIAAINAGGVSEEVMGRLAFLKLLMYFEPDIDFKYIKTWYFDFVRAIERGEKTWSDDPMKTGEQILSQARLKEREKRHFIKSPAPASSSTARTSAGGAPLEKPEVWYCPRYQRSECSEPSPHMMMLRGDMREVHHVCASCLLKSRKQLVHPDGTPACPYAQEPRQNRE